MRKNRIKKIKEKKLMNQRIIGTTILVIVFLSIMVFGVLLYHDPYLLTGNQQSQGSYVWSKGTEAKALILFNFSSKGMITTNYPITVTTNMQVLNQSLLSFLSGKKYVEIDIAGTYSFPINYNQFGIRQGNISLQFDGKCSFIGTSNIIFPYIGSSYYFSIFAYNQDEETPFPIYTMNVSDIGKAIPPTFLIDEGYSARTSYEQANQNTGLTIATIGLSGIAIIVGIKTERKKEP